MIAAFGCDRKPVVIEVSSATPVADPVAKTKTLETTKLGEAVDAYERNATVENGAVVKTALAKLDGEIAELEEYVGLHTGDQRAEASAKLKNMQAYRAAESARFAAAQAKAPVSRSVPADARTGSEKLEDSARRAGDAIEDAAKKVGDAGKDAVR